MSALEEGLARLRAFNNDIHRDDSGLAEESRVAAQGIGLESMRAGGDGSTESQIGLESIVLKRTRPVLAIRQNNAQLVFVDPADSAVWQDRLVKAKTVLDKAIRAVGRVNLQRAGLDWVGTGWLVAENIMVTNRHVAMEFAMP